MSDFDDLYKDIVKHLRVVRSIARGYREATGNIDLDRESMTPYELGRMTRSCIRLGDKIHDLIDEPSQGKIAFSFMTYMDGLGVKGHMFTKPGITTWSTLWQLGEQFLLDENIQHEHFESMLIHVGNMLDIPLREVPGRVMLLKLSL